MCYRAQDAQNTIKTQQAAKALAQERIGSISSDLSTTAAQLLDDQKYLAEVSAECKQKAELWDQRSQVPTARGCLGFLDDLRSKIQMPGHPL